MKIALNSNPSLVSTEQSLYQTICYFDIFSYPLKREEIRLYCNREISDKELDIGITELLKTGKIKTSRNYFLLPDASESVIENRLDNEIRLTRKLPAIKRFAKLVSKFPFIEAAFISGSVSKGILGEDGDVDYFIIARPNRLWVCRTFLVVFKKLFLLNSKKYFCVNYFVASDNLVIPDENIFVATEIKTLIPVFANQVSGNFKAANAWTSQYLPNHQKRETGLLESEVKKPLISKLIEKICSGSLGEKTDNFFFRMTLKRWQKKFPYFKTEEFDLNMRSYKNVSKHHPQGFQGRVIDSLNERMKRF